MKVKLVEIKKSEGALSKLLRADFPVKISYWLNKNAKPIIAELTMMEERRIELVKKSKDMKPEELQAQWDALMGEEVEIAPLKVKLADIENIKLTAEDFLAMEKVVEIEENKASK